MMRPMMAVMTKLFGKWNNRTKLLKSTLIESWFYSSTSTDIIIINDIIIVIIMILIFSDYDGYDEYDDYGDYDDYDDDDDYNDYDD